MAAFAKGRGHNQFTRRPLGRGKFSTGDVERGGRVRLQRPHVHVLQFAAHRSRPLGLDVDLRIRWQRQRHLAPPTQKLVTQRGAKFRQ